MTKIIITGAKGRMGRALAACVPQHPDLQIVAEIDQGDDLSAVIAKGDVVVDFSTHTATPGVAALCGKHKRALVIGTTGHTDTETFDIRKVEYRIPIVWASNFSTGVNTLFWLTRKAAEILGSDYDLEITEMHHRAKHDAPSGTAKTLAEILAKARSLRLPEAARHGRSGITGARKDSEIGIHSIRGGDVVGDHTVIFAGAGDTFANGALRAAAWVVKQMPGVYDMQDVLGLK
jgi:4-hydroxy-tetrahydrodipicolinate reductase